MMKILKICGLYINVHIKLHMAVMYEDIYL